MPPPVPPMVNDGRMMTGKPSSFCTVQDSSSVCATPERAEPRPILVMASLNLERSSALSMASGEAPISSQPYFSSTPLRCRSSAQFSAVWPPMVGRIAVDQDDFVAFFTQCLTGLRTGIVEFAGLTDDDRTSADDQDAFNVVTLRHVSFSPSSPQIYRTGGRCHAARAMLRGGPGSRTQAYRYGQNLAASHRTATRA